MFADLFDFTSEKELDEALLFFFVSYVLGYALMFGLGLSIDGEKSSAFSGILFSLTPSIFCVSLCILSMCKKRLNDYESLFHLGFAAIMPFLGFVFVPFFGLGLGLFIGMAPATILTTKGNNNLYVLDAIQKKETLQHKIMLEKQLLRENAIRLKNKELNKIAPKDYASF